MAAGDFLWWSDDAARGDGAGAAQSGAFMVTLANPPALGFAFDALDVNDETSTKTVAGVVTPLATDELAAARAFLAAQADMSQVHLVWGVTSDGTMLGLVAPSAAYAVTPPQPTGSYRWNFTERTWEAA